MREMKFRVLNNNYVVAVEFIGEKGWMHILMNNGETYSGPFNERDFGHTKSLKRLQFTGLLDKNGKEIYEGDVVRWGKPPLEMEERIAEVKLGAKGVSFDCRNISYPHIFYMASFAYGEKDLEIIGNIYEHPHLLNSTPNDELCDATDDASSTGDDK